LIGGHRQSVIDQRVADWSPHRVLHPPTGDLRASLISRKHETNLEVKCSRRDCDDWNRKLVVEMWGQITSIEPWFAAFIYLGVPYIHGEDGEGYRPIA